jgi:hypothetical protein
MVFPVLRKWVAKRIRKTKDARWKMAPGLRFVRPAVEQLEHRQLPSTVVPISLANSGPSVTPNGNSSGGDITADGRYVVFNSEATNIFPGQQDKNGTDDVFLYDRLTQSTTLVSHTSDSMTTTGNGRSLGGGMGSISADGRFIVYISTATNLVSGQVDSNNGFDTFLYDRLTGVNSLVTHNSSSLITAANDGGGASNISADGNFVVFQSQSTDLISGGIINNPINLYLYDRQTGSITLISHSFSSATTTGNGPTNDVTNIDASGSFIAFNSLATDLVSGEIGGSPGSQVFLYDRITGATILVSHTFGSTTTAGNNESDNTFTGISADGRFLVYQSAADNLISGEIRSNFQGDVFLYDTSTGTNTLISHSVLGSNMTGNGQSTFPVMSSDGSTIAFSSSATDLVNGQQDNNNSNDVFIYDRPTGVIALVSHSAGSQTSAANGDSTSPFVSLVPTEADWFLRAQRRTW